MSGGWIRHPITGRRLCSWWKVPGACWCQGQTSEQAEWLRAVAARVALALSTQHGTVRR